VSLDAQATAPTPTSGRWRVVAARAGTGLSAALLLAILVVPGELDHVGPAVLLRIPVEGLLALAIVLAVPARARTVVALVLGSVLGLWGVVRVVDIGFFATLDRPFDPVVDGGFLSAGFTVLHASMGLAGAVLVAVLAVVLAVGVVALVAVAGLRVTRAILPHRRPALVTVGVLAVAWAVLAATGARVVADEPIAARDFLDRIGHVPVSLRDPDVFAGTLTQDAYRDVPGNELLTALRGKDVLVVLVESYGRVAVESPEIAPTVDAVLDEGTRDLAAAGFGSRSAFLTSPTVGGGSWLASATLLSGAWVNSQPRYEYLAGTDRVTLPGAFHRAGWHTVALMPGLNDPWPEGAFFGYDEIRGSHEMDYAGPVYTFDSIPDQYVLSFFDRTERSVRGPVMAVIPLISSHAPWSPVPSLMDWSKVGDGSRFPKPGEALNPAEIILQRDVSRVRADYAHAVAYSLSTLVSYVETYGDDDLVVVFVGDHQPAPLVIGDTDNRDAPVAIVARDPAVLAHIDSWGWDTGLRPSAASPVWPMDAFRDHFLAAFS